MNKFVKAAQFLVLSLPLALPAAASAQQYAYTTIDVPGASYTSPSGINNAGHIVGTFSDGGGSHGFVYNGVGFQALDVPGASRTYAYGINDAGDVVGTFDDAKGRHGFLMAGSTFTTFTTIDFLGAEATGSWAINNAGQIVGGYYFASGVDLHAYRLTGSTFESIVVPGYALSEAIGINNAGDVVGVAYESFAPTAPNHGFVTTGTTVTVFDVLGATITNVDGINDAGHIVGVYVDAAGIAHGFLQVGNTFTRLDIPGAVSGTGAYGINNSDFIVGSYDDATGYHGFLATPVPEPATFVLLAAGLAILLGTTRRWHLLTRRSRRERTLQPRDSASTRRNAVTAAFLCGLVLGPVQPAVAAAVKAVYVEAVLPSKPFKLAVNARQLLYEDVFVIGDGAVGVTSITATNQDNVPRTLVIYETSGTTAGLGCGTLTNATYSNLPIMIPALSTVQLTFPVPLVFSATNGHTCLRIFLNENASVPVLLNGLTN